jgi:DsbC/DsbD-like thiol-disulfide interchange protein/cytochrome c biogenesis protein CcdA
VRILSFLAAFLLLGVGVAAQAQPAQTERLVDIRLIAERSSVAGGDEIWIGIEQTIAPEWHTYWRNPGDSGMEPRIEWALPQGFEMGAVQWPLPEKIPYDSLMNYGYDGTVVLLQKLKIPSTIPQGKLALQASVEILVCKDICIPEQGTYTLMLNDPAQAVFEGSAQIENALKTVPLPVQWPVEISEKDGQFIVKLTPEPSEILGTIKPQTLDFFPIDWGLVDNAVKTQAQIENGQIILQQKRGDRAAENLPSFAGVVAYETATGTKQSVEFTTALTAAAQDNAAAFTDAEKANNIITALLFALIGGVILNLMPCVFPVLSLKALSLVKIAEKHPDMARIHGLSYTAGVVLSFVAIAALLIALKAAGAQIGWGFQLQNPAIVTGLMLLLLAIGLNMAGVFELKNPFGNVGTKLASGHGYSATFFTGVLATLVATPCTAPFMAGAIAYALLQSELVALIIFAALGLGLALPYLLLSFLPALQKMLPKPGAWMVTFRKILSVPMFLAALWLGWVLLQQIGPHKNPPAFGAPYSQSALDAALQTDQPVFVEMTAAWCITCKVNHATSINIDATQALFEEHNVSYLIGDWTNQDPEITKFLQDYGRSGVPIYVYYGPKQNGGADRPKPIVLPQILTPAIVAGIFEPAQQ